MGQEESTPNIFEASQKGDIHGVQLAVARGEEINRKNDI